MGGILAFIATVLQYVPLAIEGVEGAVQVVTAGTKAIKLMVDEDRDPTPEEWDKLNEGIDAIQARLHSDDV